MWVNDRDHENHHEIGQIISINLITKNEIETINADWNVRINANTYILIRKRNFASFSINHHQEFSCDFQPIWLSLLSKILFFSNFNKFLIKPSNKAEIKKINFFSAITGIYKCNFSKKS